MCLPIRPNPLIPTLQDEGMESPTGKSLIEGAIVRRKFKRV